MKDNVDTVVLHSELACYEALPVQWRPVAQPLSHGEASRLDESNLLLLQAGVAFEEYPVRDAHDDTGPLAAELARLDFKINLVLKMLGTLIDGGNAPAPVPVRFNARGAAWESSDAGLKPGSRGVLGIRLLGSLPTSLALEAEITDNDGGTITSRFVHVSPAVSELLQKFCFLKHRRQVAEARSSRGS